MLIYLICYKNVLKIFVFLNILKIKDKKGIFNMLQKGMSKSDIERELYGKGDFVQIDNITRFLKEHLALDTKKFLYLKLIEIYDRRNMFAEAGRLYENLSELALTFDEKIKNFVKATEEYIKAGFFDRADLAMKKAFSEASPNEKPKIYLTIKEFYKTQAELYEKEKRRTNVIRIYEKLLGMNIAETEKEEIKRKLLVLYENVGMIKEFMEMKRRLEKKI
jgi:tetratricopeptide (TPR) repeat protein